MFLGRPGLHCLLINPVREKFDAPLEVVMYSLSAGTLFGLALSPLAGIITDRYPVRWPMTGGSECRDLPLVHHQSR